MTSFVRPTAIKFTVIENKKAAKTASVDNLSWKNPNYQSIIKTVGDFLLLFTNQ